jgi:hypothetical protein
MRPWWVMSATFNPAISPARSPVYAANKISSRYGWSAGNWSASAATAGGSSQAGSNFSCPSLRVVGNFTPAAGLKRSALSSTASARVPRKVRNTYRMLLGLSFLAFR